MLLRVESRERKFYMDVVYKICICDMEIGENREMLFIRHTRRDTLNEMLVGSAFDTSSASHS